MEGKYLTLDLLKSAPWYCNITHYVQGLKGNKLGNALNNTLKKLLLHKTIMLCIFFERENKQTNQPYNSRGHLIDLSLDLMRCSNDLQWNRQWGQHCFLVCFSWHVRTDFRYGFEAHFHRGAAKTILKTATSRHSGSLSIPSVFSVTQHTK